MKKQKTKTKAVIYARFSPRRNADDSESCETQIDYCNRYCHLNDLEIIDICKDENMSGATASDRPGLQKAISLACEHKAVLIVYSLSRLARNTKEACEIVDQLENCGADIASINENIDTSSSTGRFVFRLFASLAEMEREQISERTSQAMRRHQKSGRRMSAKPPFGYMVDPKDSAKLIPNNYEQDTIEKMVDLKRQGLSYAEIVYRLEEDGIKPRRVKGKDGKWHPGTWRREYICRVIQKAEAEGI